jgi:hypothetical protein
MCFHSLPILYEEKTIKEQVPTEATKFKQAGAPLLWVLRRQLQMKVLLRRFGTKAQERRIAEKD